MKTKIIMISILTIAIVGMSIIVLNDLVNKINDEANIVYTGQYIDNTLLDDNSKTWIDVPVHKKRSSGNRTATRSRGSIDLSGNSMTSQSELTSFNSGLVEFSSELTKNKQAYAISRGVQQARFERQDVNYRPIAATSINKSYQGSFQTSLPDGELQALSNSNFSKNSQPFENSGMKPRMRMEGDGENPPGEGAPVGEGLFILFALAGIYLFRFRKNN